MKKRRLLSLLRRTMVYLFAILGGLAVIGVAFFHGTLYRAGAQSGPAAGSGDRNTPGRDRHFVA